MSSETPQDTLLQSREAKSHFFQRCDLLVVDPFRVAERAGVSKEALTAWVNSGEASVLATALTQKQVMEMYETVGLMPVLHFVVTAVDQMTPEQKMVISELKSKKK